MNDHHDPTKYPQPIHLGDGAYVSMGRYPSEVVLTANHHDPEQATDTVWLDPHAVQALELWLRQRARLAELRRKEAGPDE